MSHSFWVACGFDFYLFAQLRLRFLQSNFSEARLRRNVRLKPDPQLKPELKPDTQVKLDPQLKLDPQRWRKSVLIQLSAARIIAT